ncbi:hypothetical protein [Thermodesulfobacterium hveragerdense]|uniref:hypothetical protein n=1 Tax=Thermodesulfobacterium hveragerdense TaxID=53424 RepID=UPI000403F552|nr:hypothetical protein [Thermodesulfobacterium hveragerdense]
MGYQVLLYPQTFLGIEQVEKVIALTERLLVLDLGTTKENWLKFHQEKTDLKEKVVFLGFNPDIGIDLEEVKKEVASLEEWGANFRTPENLRYFSQFRDVFENSLEDLLSAIKGVKTLKEDNVMIKSQIISLILAEKLDVFTYEIKKDLESLELKYQEVFKEKIVGEDFSFRPLEELNRLVSSSIEAQESLPNLERRIKAWQTLGSYIDFSHASGLDGLIITSSDLLESWQEKYTYSVKDEGELKVYEFKITIADLLGFPTSLTTNQKSSFVVYLKL